MELREVLTTLTTIFQTTNYQLPGEKVQNLLAPTGRKLTIKNYKGTYRQSAVLILLFPDNMGEVNLVFTKRSTYKGVHSGQISLPGGAFEKKDKNLLQTAIRETHEEIGIQVQEKNIIGKLSLLKVPVSRYEIVPYIGYISFTPTFIIQESEVSEVLPVSLSKLLEQDVQTGLFDTSYGIKIDASYYPLEKKEKVWGATAMIISEFLALFR